MEGWEREIYMYMYILRETKTEREREIWKRETDKYIPRETETAARFPSLIVRFKWKSL